MKTIQDFIERCRVKIELSRPNGETQVGGFGCGYILDQIEKGVTLEDFFIDVRSHFNED